MRKAIAASVAVVLLGVLVYAAGTGRSHIDCATYRFPSAMWKRTGATGDRTDATVKARRKAARALRSEFAPHIGLSLTAASCRTRCG